MKVSIYDILIAPIYPIHTHLSYILLYFAIKYNLNIICEQSFYNVKHTNMFSFIQSNSTYKNEKKSKTCKSQNTALDKQHNPQ